MKSYLFPLLLSLLLLPSCFVADNLFLEEEEDKLTLPFDVVVKDSVYQFIQGNKDADQKYLSYGYEPLKVIIPQTIKDLEKWKSYKGKDGFDQIEVDRKIQTLDSIRIAQNLKKLVSIEHVFSIREANDTVVNLQSVNFILSNELQVIDYVPNYLVEINPDQERMFAKLYYDSPILKAYSYEESRSLSKSFYSYFKDEWKKKDNNLDRSQFLKHAINVVGVVNKTNTFDVQLVAQEMLIDYMTQKRTDIEHYTPINFSQLYEINEDEKLVGYYFFHTFGFRMNENSQQMSVYVKFNPFYEVERVVESDQEYDVYQKDAK